MNQPENALLDVEWRPKDGNGEMRQQRRIVIELNPTNDAMVFEILRDFGFVDFEMFR